MSFEAKRGKIGKTQVFGERIEREIKCNAESQIETREKDVKNKRRGEREESDRQLDR